MKLFLIMFLIFGCGVDEQQNDYQNYIEYAETELDFEKEDKVITVTIYQGDLALIDGEYTLVFDSQTNEILSDSWPYWFDPYHFLETYQIKKRAI